MDKLYAEKGLPLIKRDGSALNPHSSSLDVRPTPTLSFGDGGITFLDGSGYRNNYMVVTNGRYQRMADGVVCCEN